MTIMMERYTFGNVLMVLVIISNSNVKGSYLETEGAKKSQSECFGGNGIRCSCVTGHQILVNKVYVGAKPTSSGCTNVSVSSNISCCKHAENDCLYDFVSHHNAINKFCNGLQVCDVGAVNDIITEQKCNVSDISPYYTSTSYMFVDYWCIEDDRIFGIGASNVNASVENVTAVYAVNDMYPESGFTMDHPEYSFAIRSDTPNTTITMHRMLLDIPCNMSIHMTDVNQSETVIWECSNNSYTPKAESFMATQIEVTITNNGLHTEGVFWFGFETPIPSNITILYLEYMAPTTTTTTTPTTQEQFNTTTSMSNSSTPQPMAVSGDENITLYIGLASGISFVVIFTALVVTVLCIMWRKNKAKDNEVDMRLSHEDMDKYFMVATEYKRVTAMPGMYDEEPTVYSTPDKNRQGEQNIETSLSEAAQSAVYATPDKSRHEYTDLETKQLDERQYLDIEPKTEI